MCGIAVAVYQASDGLDDGSYDALIAENGRRGPDGQSEWIGQVGGTGLIVRMTSAVLGLRGPYQSQPLVGKRGVLSWNGQVFRGLKVPLDGNDTRMIYEALEEGADIVQLLSNIEGPYAFAYYEFATRSIVFGRDPFGRRSLLASMNTSAFYLSSVRSPEVTMPMADVSCATIWKINLDEVDYKDTELGFPRACHPVPRAADIDGMGRASLTHIPRVAIATPEEDQDIQCIPDFATDAFVRSLRESIRLRLENIPASAPGFARMAILFSGGVDCSFLAYLSHSYIPLTEPIDLINVAFENPRTLRGQVRQDEQQKRTSSSISQHDTTPINTYTVPDRLTGREAVAELRVVCPDREWRFVEVDVPYAEAHAERARVRGLMYPNDTEMDLSLALPLYFASRGVGALHHGGTTALQPCSGAYASQAKVLISGLGADELLAGYSRHRRAFDVGSWLGTIEELQMDLDRLPTRNLGRDDRIISSHGRETRFPYLDMSFVAHAAALPVWYKIGPLDKAGGGLADKLILRAACQRAGLASAAQRKKRAMQFGTRSARMEAEIGGSKASRGMGARRLDD